MLNHGSGNRLLQDLDEEEFALFRPHLQKIAVPRGAVLSDVGQPACYVYFPVTSVLGLVGATEGGATVGVALVGREGVATASAMFGGQRLPFRVMAQSSGDAWQVRADVMHRQLLECRELQERVMLFSHTLIAQVGQSAICNRFHTAKQRLARWLLMTADRTETAELALTHEFMAHMVGGPRSAVTEAAASLRECGAIAYRRGRLTLHDLAKLRQQACECYDAMQALGTDRGS